MIYFENYLFQRIEFLLEQFIGWTFENRENQRFNGYKVFFSHFLSRC